MSILFLIGSCLAVFDIVQNNKSEFITSLPDSEEETVNILQELMSNLNKLNLLAKQALQQSENFKLEIVLKKWETLFSELNMKG